MITYTLAKILSQTKYSNLELSEVVKETHPIVLTFLFKITDPPISQTKS